MTSDDLFAISADWLKSLEVASSTGDVASFVSHFLSDGWIRDLLCFSWNFRSLSGPNEIHGFLSEVVDGKPRIEHSGLRDFKLDDHTVNAPSPFKLPGPQCIEGIQGAFTFSITQPAALGRGFFRLTQDVDGRWKALTLFTNMQDLVGYEESLADQHGLYEDRGITWEEDVDGRFRAIEADPTVLIIGGGLSGLMTAARLRRLGIRALVIEKNARVGDSWRQRYPNLTLHTPAVLYSPYPSTFPKYIPKGKLANFLDSYAVDHGTCTTRHPARWTVEVQRGDQTVFINPKHLVLATGSGSPRVPTWNEWTNSKEPCIHSDLHKGHRAIPRQTRCRCGCGKSHVSISYGNASADICQDFVAHGAAEVTMAQRSATCVVSSMNLSGGAQHMKMLDKELHEALSKVGFNLTWELSPGSGEVGVAGFVFKRLAAGTMLDIGCGKLIIEGKVKIKQGQDISHPDKDGITFKDGSKLPADVIVLAYGLTDYEPLLGNEITDQLPPEVWGLDSEGELNQIYRPSGRPGLWFAIGGFPISRFFS
ncbi:FAD/NAD(P)-binding domain-containing protein [Suillus occidentalis]|nr:FAD/NAD(P)-binding domain-containing protein [Suillus occidentalis]